MSTIARRAASRQRHPDGDGPAAVARPRGRPEWGRGGESRRRARGGAGSGPDGKEGRSDPRAQACQAMGEVASKSRLVVSWTGAGGGEGEGIDRAGAGLGGATAPVGSLAGTRTQK